MIDEIKLVFKNKLKVFFRQDFWFRFKIKYIFIFIISFLYCLRLSFLYPNYFFNISLISLIIVGFDYHNIYNNSYIDSFKLNTYLLNKKKSNLVAFFSEALVKTLIILPFLFLIKEKLCFLLYFLIFYFFSFSLKELLARNIYSKNMYSIFMFPFLLGISVFGNLFADDLNVKQSRIIELLEVNFINVNTILLIVLSGLSIIFSYQYLKYFDK